MSEKVLVPVNVRVAFLTVKVPLLLQVPPTVTPKLEEALVSNVPAVMVKLLVVLNASCKV